MTATTEELQAAPWRARPIAAAAALGTPPPAGAASQDTADAPAPPAPPLTLPVLRVVAGQLAVGTGLLGAAWAAQGGPWPAAAAVIAGGSGGLAAATVRVRGSWASELTVRRISYNRRSRDADLSADRSDPARALIGLLAPDARLGDAELAGRWAGIVTRPAGVSAVLAVPDGPPGRLARLAFSGDLMPESDPRLPDLDLRVLLHRGPMTAGGPLVRGWLVVQARRDADITDDADLHTALANALRRGLRACRRAGLVAEVPSSAEVAATVAALSHTGGGRTQVREQWRHWFAGPVAQVGLHVSAGAGSPAARAAALDCLLGATPAVACTLAARAGGPGLEAVLRVAAPTPAAVDAAVEHLRTVAPQYGLRCRRLDGSHARAVADTLPLGGA